MQPITLRSIGADPEFELLDGAGHYLFASDVVRREHTIKGVGSWGVDGSGAQLEVRPEPVVPSETGTLYRRIHDLATRAARNRKLKVSLAGHRYPLGFHVHLGYDAPPIVYRSYQERVKFVDGLAMVVDGAVGEFVELSGSARGHYATRREVRTQPWGLEYRTLPTSLLATETLACGVLDAIVRTVRGEDGITVVRQPDFLRDLDRAHEMVATRQPFTFGFRPLYPAPQLCERDTWSEQFGQLIRSLLPSHVAVHVRLFGYAGHRGLVTNCPQLAKLMGWSMAGNAVACYTTDGRTNIGLPLVYRLSSSPERFREFLDFLRYHVARGGPCA